MSEAGPGASTRSVLAAATTPPSISVVMPVFDGLAFLPRSLAPLAGAFARGVVEWIVVDDGSQDGSAAFARASGARVIESGGRLGPAAARNAGAAVACGEVLLFVDADVVMHADVPERLSAAFGAPSDADLVAIFGSYDDAPPDPAMASGYMNLRHHFVHQAAAGDASTFWAGLGAVRRAAFLATGGFDATRYARPAIEDIELGHRLREAGGRIRLDPSLQGTHLKRWSWGGVLRTDLFARALPWSRLIHERPGFESALNVRGIERLRALLAVAFATSLLATGIGVSGIGWPCTAGALALLANARLAAFFAARRGVLFAAVAMLWHQFYYLYSSAVFIGVGLAHRVRRTGLSQGRA